MSMMCKLHRQYAPCIGCMQAAIAEKSAELKAAKEEIERLTKKLAVYSDDGSGLERELPDRIAWQAKEKG